MDSRRNNPQTSPAAASPIEQARAAFARRELPRAQAICEKLLSENPKHGDALILMHHVALRQNRRTEAVACLQRFIEGFPKSPIGYIQLGDYHMRLGEYEDAVSRFHKALDVHPDHPGALCLMARALDMMGRSEEAQALLAPHIGTPREDAGIAFSYANLEIDAKRYRNAVEAASRHVDDAQAPPQLRREVLFVLGKALERCGETDKAFAAYRRANDTTPFGFDFDLFRARAARMMEIFSADWRSSMPQGRCDSQVPLFIVSRPRTGSTLVERILGAHPDVHSAGENESIPQLAGRLGREIGSARAYPDCLLDLKQEHVDRFGREQAEELQRLRPGARRVTVKQLNMWAHLGLVQLILPEARVIDLRRDPVDNCFACFSESLGALLPYQGDMRLLGLGYRLYEKMMEHWSETLSLRTLQIRYEDLVREPEPWTRRIIEFAGLEWDDRCLEHYRSKQGGSSTAAPTLSYQQVRQPIYTGSVGRSERFAKHLDPLRASLAEGASIWPLKRNWPEQRNGHQATAAGSGEDQPA